MPNSCYFVYLCLVIVYATLPVLFRLVDTDLIDFQEKSLLSSRVVKFPERTFEIL